MGEVTKIGVVGCGGRMGRMNLSVIEAEPRAAIAGGTEQSGTAVIGEDIGSLIGKPTRRSFGER